jgi:diguanylate cyclase (GGDEF)-like protein
MVQTAERTLSYHATHDPLTGLPNRELLAARLDEAIERARSGGGVPAIAHLGLDEFKTVNDAVGREAGDEMLRQVADRLKDALRPGDTLARIGGDEFAALFVASSADRCASAEADVRAAIAEHPGIGSFRLSAAIGAAAHPPAASLAVALEEADARVYAEKRGTPGSRLQPTG